MSTTNDSSSNAFNEPGNEKLGTAYSRANIEYPMSLWGVGQLYDQLRKVVGIEIVSLISTFTKYS